MPQRIMAMAPATVTLAVYANGTRPVYRAVCPAAIWAHHAIATTTKTIKCYQMAMTCASHTMLARYVGHVILSKPYTPAFWGEVLSSHTIQQCVCVWESPITSFVNVLLWNVPLRLHRPIVVNSRYIKWALHGIPCQAGNMRICAHLRWHFCCCCKMSTTECHVMLLFSGVLLKRLGLPQHHLPVYIPLHKILWHFPIHPANNVLSWFIFRMFGCCCCKCILLFCHLCISLKWYSIYYVIVSSRHTHNSHTLTHNALFSVLSFFATFEQDILEKIRECGSSVTYYGGRVLNNHHSTGASPISKAIMREIHNGDSICGVCQPHNCPQRNKLFTSFCGSDNSNSHLGKSWFCILAIHLIRCQIQLKIQTILGKLPEIYLFNRRLRRERHNTTNMIFIFFFLLTHISNEAA